VIGLPPSEEGAVQLTVAWASPEIALTSVGAPGMLVGVTEFDGPEAGESPTPLLAVTVKV
jgi:hypothetical protein